MATHSSILAWEIPWTKKRIGAHKELETTGKLNNSDRISILYQNRKYG